MATGSRQWTEQAERQLREEAEHDKAISIARGLAWCDTCANLKVIRDADSKIVPCPICQSAKATEPKAPSSQSMIDWATRIYDEDQSANAEQEDT